MGSFGFYEIMIIAVIVLLLFGGKKIPELMKGVGKGIREFSSAKNNVGNEHETEMNEKERSTVEVSTATNP